MAEGEIAIGDMMRLPHGHKKTVMHFTKLIEGVSLRITTFSAPTNVSFLTPAKLNYSL
jgi:hypothetical protein